MDYGDRLEAVIRVIRKSLNDAGYGSFVGDETIEELANKILAALGFKP